MGYLFDYKEKTILKENLETSLGEARNVVKISAEIRKLFEKQKEHCKVELDGNLLIKNIVEEMLENGLNNIKTYNRIIEEVD